MNDPDRGSAAAEAIQEQVPVRCPMWRLPYVLIQAYRRWLSPWLPAVCRFHPSCSVYAAESLKRHGLWTGGRMATLRILRCHPWHPGGYDPVPEKSGD